MDYNQEQFFRAQFDVPKMPFYMSYPMQNLYLTEMEYEKDMDRMKELYPKEVGRIVECVEDECDRMEYEGSLMFDEYPDRLMIEMVVDRIQKKVTGEDGELEAEQFHGGMQPPPGHRPPPPPPPGQNDHLRELIGVILNNEVYPAAADAGGNGGAKPRIRSKTILKNQRKSLRIYFKMHTI